MYKCKHIAIANEGEANETHVVQLINEADSSDRITITDPKGAFIAGLKFGSSYELTEAPAATS